MEIDWVHDQRVRYAAFDWLGRQVSKGGGLVSNAALEQGFMFDGRRVPLTGGRGIFVAQGMRVPLSIRSSTRSSYENEFDSDGLLRYRYQSGGANNRDNVGLREVMRLRLPMVYLHGIVGGRYAVVWPVFVVRDLADEGVFLVRL